MQIPKYTLSPIGCSHSQESNTQKEVALDADPMNAMNNNLYNSVPRDCSIQQGIFNKELLKLHPQACHQRKGKDFDCNHLKK